MAEQGPATERQVVPLSAAKRTWESGGKEKAAWTVVFQYEADGKKGQSKADTWSAECAKVCEDNIGKPLLVSVADTGREYQGNKVFDIVKIRSADGKAELYSGGQTKRGGQRGSYNQRPDWSYADASEREGERRSIEAQVAEKAAVEYLGFLVQFGDHEDEKTKELLTVEGARKFAKVMSDDIRDRMRKAAAVRSMSAAKSGSGVAERPSPDPGDRTRGAESHRASGGEEAIEPPLLSASAEQGEGTLTSEPDLAAELTDARNTALQVFKTQKAVVQAWAQINDGEIKAFKDLTADELASLAANPPESGALNVAEQPAGMASGSWG